DDTRLEGDPSAGTHGGRIVDVPPVLIRVRRGLIQQGDRLDLSGRRPPVYPLRKAAKLVAHAGAERDVVGTIDARRRERQDGPGPGGRGRGELSPLHDRICRRGGT